MFLHCRLSKLNKKAGFQLSWENIVKLIIVLAVIIFVLWLAYKGVGLFKETFRGL